MRVIVNDNELEVELLGPENGPLLIAHHGAPGLGSRAEPRASFGRLSDRFRVLVFDARGSGDSQGRPPFTHEQWVADVDALREWAGAERFVIAGGSYGGFIALEYAIRHPRRLTAMVLRDTSPDHDNEAAAWHNAVSSDRVTVDRDRLRRIHTGQIRDNADFEDCWREILPLYDHAYDPDLVEVRARETTYHYETHNYAFAVNQPAYDVKDRLHHITCPVLVTVGRHDWITPVEASERIVSRIPGARLAVFEHSGHSPQIEEADLWVRTVGDFLHEVGADTAVGV